VRPRSSCGPRLVLRALVQQYCHELQCFCPLQHQRLGMCLKTSQNDGFQGICQDCGCASICRIPTERDHAIALLCACHGTLSYQHSDSTHVVCNYHLTLPLNIVTRLPIIETIWSTSCLEHRAQYRSRTPNILELGMLQSLVYLKHEWWPRDVSLGIEAKN
jgi:hypothetical protein